ncbi:MAG: S-layer homology domain-containing protein [Actinobacteria bacterium]|nr:S-layer homology domain-containing protein [Actinomycetota bacterium]
MTALTKTARFLGFLILTLVFIHTFPVPAPASIQAESVLESRPVAEGLVLEKHVLSVGGGKTLVYILRANITSPYLKINTIVGSDGSFAKNGKVAEMAVKSGAVAAVNADFFQMGESGRPIGMTFRDGRLVSSPPLRSDMYGWGITRDGKPLIDLFSFTGKVTAANGKSYSLAGINKPSYYVGGDDSAPVTSHENALLMYDRQWGETSRGKVGEADSVVEVFVSGGIVTDVLVSQAGSKITDGGLVLAGRGLAADFINQNIKVGDRISVDFSVNPNGNDLWAGTGGWSLLVEGGKAKSSFPGSINGPVARTAVGYTTDGKTLLVVVAEKSSASRGLTLNELAEYMVGLRVEKALNLDGGGSTTLAARPLGEESPVLVNRPQNSAQRLVPTVLGFFSSAPQGSLAGLLIKGPDRILPGDDAGYTLKGYDSHFNPAAVEQGKIKWSVDSGPGFFTNSTFKSDKGGLTTISASYGGRTVTMPVKVLGPGDFKRVVVDPSSIVLQPGKTAALSVKAVGNDDTVYNLSDRHYSVAVDNKLGTYQGGVFRASDNASAGELKIVFDGISVTVPVNIKGDDQAAISFTPGQPGQLKLGSCVISIPGGAFSGPVSLTADLNGEMPVPVPERYKMVSAVNVRAAGDTTVLAEPASVEWKYQPGEAGRMAVIQLTGDMWVEIPSSIYQEEGRISCAVRDLGTLALVRDQNPPVSFVDMEGHWAEEIVSGLAGEGIISGYPGNIFDPSRQVTRAEFSVMLCRVFGWGPEEGRAGFRDEAAIPGWAGGFVMAAYNKGVISGYEDRTFLPARQVTRAEMAAMVCSALSLEPAKNVRLDSVFRDGGSIDKWAVGPVSAVYATGLMKGDNENSFRARDRATRAESAVLMDNVLKYRLKGQIRIN